MSMNSFKKFALATAAISIAIVDITPVGASSPNDPTTTTAAPAAEATTTTGAPASGDATTTTVPGAAAPAATDTAVPTTIPGLDNTLLAPLPSDAKPDNVDLVPATTAPASTLPPATAGNTKSGPDIMASANQTSVVTTDLNAVVIVRLSNMGNVAAGIEAPVSFSLAKLPRGVKVLEVLPTLNDKSAIGDQGWECNATSCTLKQKTDAGISSGIIPVAGVVRADLRVNYAPDAELFVADDAYTTKSNDLAEKRDIAGIQALSRTVPHFLVRASLAGDVAPENDEFALAVLGAPRSNAGTSAADDTRRSSCVYVDGEPSGNTYPGGRFKIVLRTLPVCDQAFSGDITFTDILPAQIGLTDVKISGNGWTCDDPAAPKRCTRTGGEIQPSFFSEPLIIEGRTSKTAAVTAQPFTWKVNSVSRVKADGTQLEALAELTSQINEAPKPDLVAKVIARDGKTSMVAPGTLLVDAKVRSINGIGQNVAVTVGVRKGVTMEKAADGSPGWTCASAAADPAAGEGSTALKCVKAELFDTAEETIAFKFTTTEETETGAAQVISVISAENEDAAKVENNRSGQTLLVQPAPAAMPGIVFTRADEKGATQAVSDGSTTEIVVGKKASYGLAVSNLGAVPIAAGTVVRLEQFVSDFAIFSGKSAPKDADFKGDLDGKKIPATPGQWACVAGQGTPPVVQLPESLAGAGEAIAAPAPVATPGKKGAAIRCELTLAAAVAPEAQTPILNLTVEAANSAKPGKPEWPVYASLPTVKTAPVARYGMGITIVKQQPALTAAIAAPAGPRPGGKAAAQFSVKNEGTADSNAQSMIIKTKGGRLTGAKGEGWSCAVVGGFIAEGFIACSRKLPLKVGEVSKAVAVDYQSSDPKAKKMVLQATSIVSNIYGQPTSQTSTQEIDLRAPLSFSIQGPDVIVDQIVDATGKRMPSSILLTTVGNADGSKFTWRQLCTTDADVKASNGQCKAVTSAAKWVNDAPSTGPTANLLAPAVKAEETLVFEATALDEAGTSHTARFSVRVQPLPTAQGPTGKAGSGSGSSVLRRVPKQSGPSVRAFAATAPTSGAGDTSVLTSANAGVTVNGNIFGGSTLTVAQGAAVSVTAAASGVGAVTYAWSQAAGPTPSVLAAAATNTATVAFTAPAANTTISLRVVATDSRGEKATDVVTVVVGTGGAATLSANIAEGEGPLAVDTAKAVALNATATGSGAITYAWSQVSGPALTLNGANTAALSIAASAAIGTAVILVTATDATGASATDQITLQMNPSGAPTPLCDFVEAISTNTSSKLEATYKAIGIGNLDLSQLKVNSSTCSESSKVSFSNAGFSLAGYLTVSGASGTISAAGLTIRSATFTGPESWGSPVFSIGGTDPVGLFIPFSRASVAIGAFEGKIESGSMPFLKLPAGWTPAATLTFSVDAEGGKAVSLEATATGPEKNGKKPTARIAGAVATNGTFSLDASLANGFELFGSTIDFTGSVKRETPEADVAVSLAGALQGEIALTSNVKITALSASYDKGGAITGSGTMTIGSGDTALAVTADLNYTDANNHSFAVKAATTGGKWSPGKDISIPLASASGSYVAKDGAKTIDVTVVGGDVSPFSGLKFVAPTIKATAQCPATGACDVKVNLDSGAEVTLGSTSTTGKITGAVDITNKTASLKASLDKIPLVAGLDITSASLSIDSTNIGAANAATTVTLAGSMTVFEKTVSASATFSKTGVLLTADLPELAPFGASGPVWKPGQLSWSSGPISITPKVPSLPNIKSVNLTPKVPRLNMAIALPEQIKGLASATVSNVGDIALDGEVDFSTGKFSLAASLSNDSIDLAGAISREKTGDPFKYNLTGKVKKAIALTDSVSITTLDVTFGNATAGGPLTLTGNGSVDVKLPDSTVVTVAGAVAYNSATDFTVTVSAGATAPSFAVTGGEALSLGQASGTFKRTAAGSVLDVNLSTAGPWKPVSGLSVTNVSAKASVTCNTGAKCVPAFDLKGTLGFDLGITGLNSAEISGKLDDKGFAFSAKFNDLAFNADIKLLAPTFSLAIPPKTSTDRASASLSGTFALFGATLNANVNFSSAGVLLTGDFPSFKFPNSDIGFDGGQFAWALRAPSNINWTPKVPNFPSLPAISLPAGAPRLVLSMPTPDVVKQLSGSTTLTFGAVKVEGNMTLASGAFSLTATYDSNATNITGTFSREGTGKNLVYDISAKVKQPLTVIDGVKVASLDLKLNNTTGSVQATGTGDIEISTPTTPIVLGFNLNYVSSTDYSFQVTVKPTGGTTSWSPFPGFSLPLGNLTGTMVRKDQTRTFSLAFKGITDWFPVGSAAGPGVRVSEPGAAVTATCQVGGKCELVFTATGRVSVNVGQGWTTPATLTGTFTKDRSELKAVFADLPVTAGVTIKAPTLAVAYATQGGLSASVAGSADVLGTTLSMSATFSAQGVIVSGGMNDWTPIPGGPTLTNASFAFATYNALQVTLPNAPNLGKVDIPLNNPTLLAGFKVPQWLKDMVKQPSLNVVPVTVPLKDLAAGKLPTLKIMLPTPGDWFLFKTSSLSMRFAGFGVEIGGSPTPSMSLIGNIEFITGSGQTPIPLEVRGTVSTTAISMALSLGIDSTTGKPYEWKNAFGISGLTLSDAAIQVGINFATTPFPLPTIGIAATAQLPDAWKKPLGMEAGVAVRLMANIDVTKPCFQFKAGTLGGDGKTISAGSAKVINVGSGVLTSTFMDLTIAPLGCQIGNQILDPGISVGFSGTVLGTPVDVRAKIGTNPFSLEASLAIGAFRAGGVQVDETRLTIKVSPTESFVAFAGGITIGSTKVSVNGNIGYNVTDGPWVDLTGSVDNLSIVPGFLEIRSAAVRVNVRPKNGFAEVQARGDFNFLGAVTQVDFAMSMSNFKLQTLKANVRAVRTIAGVVKIDGTFSIDYKDGQFPTLAFDATGSVAGYDFGRVTGVVDKNQVKITGTISVGGVFSAQLTGQVVWAAGSGITIVNRDGQTVTAAAGDFRVGADNITINLGGFGASGSVLVGRASGVAYARFNASFSIGSGNIGGNLSVSGDFGTDGNFRFAGSGNLNLVGFSAAVNVSGSKSGANWAFALSTNIRVLGAVDVGFSGNFSRTNNAFRFTMTGNASLSAAGVAASGSFTISNEPGREGMSASVSLQVPGISGSGSIAINADGTFDASIGVSVSLGIVRAGGTLKMGNVAYWNGQRYRGGTYFSVSGYFETAGIGFWFSGNINANGSFDFSVNSGFNWNSGEVYLVVVKLRLSASVNASLRIYSWSPYFSFSASGTVSVQGSRYYIDAGCRAWKPKCWWNDGWTGWSNWVSLGLGFSVNPTSIWVDYDGRRYGIR
ncbi:MAG: hypothetical protein KJS66_00305 [Acidobacteria bacterium]|nr:hypothetical protein [Acidobacteriota bacterium]